jgi:redox-sensitive bicupin YhaK (pirin superfamily)
MVKIRPASRRGRTQIDWLDSRHTFSFGDYSEPSQMGFRSLRVINDDRVAPNAGFGTHGHHDMEIITYVLDGELEHRDSLGTGDVIRRGDVQRMTAGTGIRHSEFNPSKTKPVHFLQIWVLPERPGLPPSYAQKTFAESEKRGRLRVIAAPDGRDGALSIHQDVQFFAAILEANDSVAHELQKGRAAWVQVARGHIELNGQTLAEGDGAAVVHESHLELRAGDNAEILIFDLA